MIKLISVIFVSSLFVGFIESCYKSDVQYKWYTPTLPIKAIATMKGEIVDTTNNNVTNKITGFISFTQSEADGSVTVAVNITGLMVGKTASHGLHVHSFTIKSTSDSVTDICGSTGSHYNPSSLTHGDLTASTRHVGDLGNVNAVNGVILTTITDRVVQLYGQYSIIGRTVVLHALPDDLGLGGVAASLTTGNSGARIACGVVGYES